jgi:uncharacterized Zn-finger protein
MKCVCCLVESGDRKDFCAIRPADEKAYKSFTNLELPQLSLNFWRICKECKQSLKSSSSFLQTCLKAHAQLGNDESEEKKETRRTRKRRIKAESDDDDPPPESNLEASDDEDNLPIAALQQQAILETLTTQPEPPQPYETPETLEDPQEPSDEPLKTEPADKPSLKFLCPDCGVSFQTSQRLQIHSYTHSGIKNYKCDFDGCEKSFATSESFV